MRFTHQASARARAVSIYAALLLLPAGLARAQGSLTPPGPPAPNLKTLAQIEPRAPIAVPGQTIGTGSYYLTASLTATSGMSGIVVLASNVTIDLNGFELIGVPGSSEGIVIGGGQTNVTIRNGTIRNWGGRGIDGVGNARVRVENVRVLNCGGNGIVVDVDGEVRNCVASGNVGNGIKGLDNCLVRECQVLATTGSPGNGISVGAACSVTDCISRGNLGVGFFVGDASTISRSVAYANFSGIITGDGCTVAGCTSMNSGAGLGIGLSSGCIATDCASRNNGSDGFYCADGCAIRNCALTGNAGIGFHSLGSVHLEGSTAMGNAGPGIQISGGINMGEGLVINCVANRNTGNGIIANRGGNRLEGNLVRANQQPGIVAGGSDIVVHNVSRGNTGGNYSPASGFQMGPVQTPDTAASPWANF